MPRCNTDVQAHSSMFLFIYRAKKHYMLVSRLCEQQGIVLQQSPSAVQCPRCRVCTCRPMVCSRRRRQARDCVREDSCVGVLEELDVALKTAVCAVWLLKAISKVVELWVQASLVLYVIHARVLCWSHLKCNHSSIYYVHNDTVLVTLTM